MPPHPDTTEEKSKGFSSVSFYNPLISNQIQTGTHSILDYIEEWAQRKDSTIAEVGKFSWKV